MNSMKLLAIMSIVTVCGFSIARSATLTMLYSFSNGVDGAQPETELVQGSDGYFYGTTTSGGTNRVGTVFRIGSAGSFTTLYQFSGGADGAQPVAGLVQGSDGYFYGTAQYGGTSTNCGGGGCGTVFKISPSGTFITVHNFNGGSDGNNPFAGLVQGSDGYFYGTTLESLDNRGGSVFKMSSTGTLTTLHQFTGGTDGGNPYARLVQGNDGWFYGTTYQEGASTNCGGIGCGTVFRISSNGTFVTLHSFGGGNDGASPYAELVQGSDGYFYGTTIAGGTNTSLGTFGSGTVFKMNSAGTLTTLHQFSGGTDGGNPLAGLLQGIDGYFYGTASVGGTNVYGTVFKISSSGALTTVHDFNGDTDGAFPHAGLVSGNDGCFYGTTSSGGTNACQFGCGMVFKLCITCSFSIDPTNETFVPVVGSNSVAVATDSLCSWTATSNDGWITITSAQSTLGNGVVTYTVSPNPNLSGRVGTMTVAGQTFTVSQAGNTAPQVSIVPVAPVTLPLATVNLDATVTDDGAPFGTINATRSKVSGPGTVGFGNVNAIDTAATFSTNGMYVLRLTASDGALSASNDVTVIINMRPTITSPPAVTNQLTTVGGNPVVQPGDAIAFSIGATDADGNPLSCLWDFGDGQTSLDCEPSHVFSNCGPHDVTAIVSDGIVPVTNNLLVSVTCPFSQLPKPVSLKMKSNFVPGKLDTAAFKTFLDMPAGFTAVNTPVSLEVAGASVPFTLNAKGQGANAFSTIKVTHKGSATSTVWRVTGKLKGDYDAIWQNYGLTNATVTAVPITVPALLLFDTQSPESFSIDKPLLYKATAGKSGTGQ
jgi:uncharacterized repeat protein (TIGR03803 family)